MTPHPAPPLHPDHLPDALTFFVTRAQRQAILARLNTPAPNRTQALLTLLGITPPNKPTNPHPLPPDR